MLQIVPAIQLCTFKQTLIVRISSAKSFWMPVVRPKEVTHFQHCVFSSAYRQTNSCSSNPARWQLASSIAQMSLKCSWVQQTRFFFGERGRISSRLLDVQTSHSKGIFHRFVENTYGRWNRKLQIKCSVWQTLKNNLSALCFLHQAVVMAILKAKKTITGTKNLQGRCRKQSLKDQGDLSQATNFMQQWRRSTAHKREEDKRLWWNGFWGKKRKRTVPSKHFKHYLELLLFTNV